MNYGPIRVSESAELLTGGGELLQKVKILVNQWKVQRNEAAKMMVLRYDQVLHHRY